MNQEQTAALADQYFADLARDGRQDNPENLRAWLWFTCPAHLRGEVRERIEETRQEIVDTVVCSRCGKLLSRDYVYPQKHYRSYEHSGVFLGSTGGDDNVLCSDCYKP